MTQSWPNGVPAVVTVVDDDESIRESLPELLRSCGYIVHAFASAESFQESEACVLGTQCLILDVAMPGKSGPDLQRELRADGVEIPVVYITALGDERSRARLLAGGAIDILLKPFSEESLLNAVRAALQVRSQP